MKNYKFEFYPNRPNSIPSVYYRQFATYKEAKEWANYTLREDSLKARYKIHEISLTEFLESTK